LNTFIFFYTFGGVILQITSFSFKIKIVEHILEINQLSKNYGNIQAIKNISLRVEAGQVYGILGPNGSGKTTTLGVILGILAPQSGSYNWFGHGLDADVRKRIGSLIETPNFYPYLSLYENLMIIATIKGIKKEAINHALGITNLLKRKYSKFSHLSLGMKQRMGLAAALLGNPDVLVLDEPTNGLDPEGFAEVREIIQEQSREGKTILLASHILDEVEKVCSHVAVLKSGELIANGKVGTLLRGDKIVRVSSSKNQELNEFLKQQKAVKAVKSEDEDLVITLEEGLGAAEINTLAHQKGIVLSKL